MIATAHRNSPVLVLPMNMTATLLILAGLSLGQDSPTDFYQNFRNGHKPLPALSLVGPMPETTTRPEAGGLRVTLNASAKDKRAQAVGVMSKFAVSGDFEITGTYELLSTEKLKDSANVGVNLVIVTRGEPRKTAGIGRFDRAKGGALFSANFNKGEADDAPHHHSVPATGSVGQLRLKREGSKLNLLARTLKNNEKFLEILEVEYGPEQIDVIRFVVTSGGSQAAVDARLIDLRVHSTSLPNVSPMHPDAVPDQGFGWITLGGGILFSCALAGGYYFIRKRR